MTEAAAVEFEFECDNCAEEFDGPPYLWKPLTGALINLCARCFATAFEDMWDVVERARQLRQFMGDRANRSSAWEDFVCSLAVFEREEGVSRVAAAEQIRDQPEPPVGTAEAARRLENEPISAFLLGQLDLFAGQIITHNQRHAWLVGSRYAVPWQQCDECTAMARTVIASVEQERGRAAISDLRAAVEELIDDAKTLVSESYADVTTDGQPYSGLVKARAEAKASIDKAVARLRAMEGGNG